MIIALKIVYWLGMVLEVVIRAPFEKMHRSAKKTDQRESLIEKLLVGLLSVVQGLIPLVYTFTHWLDFANYALPAWLGWIGIIMMICALLLFYFAHRDLKGNWSPSLEIRQDHTLVTGGIYHLIRHPMYASNLFWVIAQLLLLQNWLAGPTGLLFFIPFYLLRVKGEEKMMLDTFDDQYREYMNNVGGLFPKLTSPHN